MRILIVEDEDLKYEDLVRRIEVEFGDFSIDIRRSRSIHEYVKIVDAMKFDLIIFDIMLPRDNGGEAFDSSLVLTEEVIGSKNEETKAIALTAMIAPEYDALMRFNERTVPVLLYDDSSNAWWDVLRGYIAGVPNSSKIEFLICCALDKEAAAFEGIGVDLGPWKREAGVLRWRRVTIEGINGAICVFPRMGMTNAALTTTKAVELFRPKLVAMSGICAGIKDEVEFLDIVVAESAWDHQVGKITNHGFKQELYQENVDPEVISLLKHEWDSSETLRELKRHVWEASKGKFDPNVRFGPVASGSVVVASSKAVAEIEKQQRKVIGIEMELAAVFAACSYSSVKPMFFGAKAVVDFADEGKDDLAHELGASTSARYVSAMIPQVLAAFSK